MRKHLALLVLPIWCAASVCGATGRERSSDEELDWLLRSKQWEEASKQIAKMEKADLCGGAVCLAGEALVLNGRRKAAEAQETARRAVEKLGDGPPMSAWRYNELGVLLYRGATSNREDVQRAELALRRAAAAYQGHTSNIKFNLATVLGELGNREQSKTLLAEIEADGGILVDGGMSIVGDYKGPGIAAALAAQEEKKPADEIHRVGGDVTAPKLLTRAEPSYPQGAREERIEGVVILEAVITASGNVADVKVLKSVHPLVDAAATDAVRQWIYRPATRNGNAVAVYLTVTVTFNLGVRPPKPRPRDSLIGTWQVAGQRAWVQIDTRARAYACRITNTDVISKASGVIKRTPEGTVIIWEGNWSSEAVSRDGDELLLIRPGTALRFHPYDATMAKSCAQK